MRITRSMLQSRVDRLNVVLNRPLTGWTRLTTPAKDGHTMRSNEGHFVLSTNSPGDGWTRYSLSQMVGENGGESTVSPTCTAQEMWAYLRGVFDVLDSEYTHNFDKKLPTLPPVEYCECGRLRSDCVGGYAKNRNTLHADKAGAK